MMEQVIEPIKRFVRLTQMMEQVIEWIQRFIRLTQVMEQITLIGLQDKITGQQSGAAQKIGKACSQEQNDAEFALQKGEKQLEKVI